MAWLKDLLGGKRVVEYRLCEEDRQLVEGLQFQLSALFEEIQALSMELNATRAILEGMDEKMATNDLPRSRTAEKGKGRAHRPPNGKDNQRQSKGEV